MKNSVPGNKRILIVDDNRAIHGDFAAILAPGHQSNTLLNEAEAVIFGKATASEPDDFDLDSAFQGQEALEKVKQALAENRPYAMAFVDVRMPPGWDGIETISRIWKVDPDLQVVICTAFSDYQWSEINDILGQTDRLLILKKPFDNIEVYQLASALTEKWRLAQLARISQEELEKKVEQRTLQLKDANEETKLMAEKALAANRAKSEFLANMSHEIRTPMNVIIGFADLLAEENLNQAQKQYVWSICESGNNLLTIIDDILDFSKIEAGKLKLNTTECPLEHILMHIDSTMSALAAQKNLGFGIIRRGQLPSTIHTDPGRLRQCLINLANNAIKYTNEGYVHILVTTGCGKNDEMLLHFDVKDTGIGIAPEVREAIFEAFVQADGSSTRKYEGTGLGLAITKQLAELLGGGITLSSSPGKGSTFSLTVATGLSMDDLPKISVPTGDDQQDNNKANAHVPQFSGKVLVVEDKESNQKLVKLLLEKHGLDVIIANNGREALEICEKQSFDMIFMDIQMPHMNGYEATGILRGKGITTPIVALTAHALRGDDEKCFDAGCSAYLSKPIVKDKFLEILNRYLTGSKPQ